MGCGPGLHQLGTVLSNHPIWHRMLALLIPLPAQANRCIKPPANPLHRLRQRQGLGDGQPKVSFDITGFHNRCRTFAEGLTELAVNGGFYFRPWSAVVGVAIELVADLSAGDVMDGAVVLGL